MPKKKRKKRIKPPPPDPENYTRVDTREGTYWRPKRGTIKEAKLNDAFEKNANNSKWSSPAAKNIRERLHDFLNNLDLGRFIGTVSSRLSKEYNKTGTVNYSELMGYDLQPYRPLWNIFSGNVYVYKKNGELMLNVKSVSRNVKKLSKFINGYFFEAILLSGDPTKPKSLRVESDTSPMYDFNQKEIDCTLSVSLPSKKPWMFLFKVSCTEDGEPGKHARYYGMKVVGVGG